MCAYIRELSSLQIIKLSLLSCYSGQYLELSLQSTQQESSSFSRSRSAQLTLDSILTKETFSLSLTINTVDEKKSFFFYVETPRAMKAEKLAFFEAQSPAKLFKYSLSSRCSQTYFSLIVRDETST